MRFHIHTNKSIYSTIVTMERKKLFYSKTFWVALIIGLAIVTLNTLYMVSSEGMLSEAELFLEEGIVVNPEIYEGTLYNSWIGNEAYTFSFSLYYFLFPMLCILPYGWSLSTEMQSGYLKNIVVRVKRKHYFRIKYGMACLGGGLVGTIPLLVNFIVDAMFLPALKPDIIYSYYMTMQPDFLADFYSVHPLLFNILFFVFSFLYFGLIAGCAVACTFLTKSRVMTMLSPVGVFYILHYISSMIPYPACRYDLSPLYCIHPTSVRYYSSGWVLFGYMILMILFPVIVEKIKGNEDYEIY